MASYNIHRGVGTDRRYRPERIAEVIATLDADILGLQEVDWHEHPDTGAPQWAYFTACTGLTAIAGPNIRAHRGHYGNVLLTRLPAKEVRLIDLAVPGYEPRGAIDADIDVGGALLRVVVTHLGLRLRERRRQVSRLKAVLEEGPPRPTVVLGDFNDWLPGKPSLRRLLERFGPHRTPATYPAHRPFFALDRILASPPQALRNLAIHAGELARRASDHLPVTAAFDRGVLAAMGAPGESLAFSSAVHI